MKVRITFELGDHERRALARWFGEGGKATRETIVTFIESEISNTMDDIVSEYEERDRSES